MRRALSLCILLLLVAACAAPPAPAAPADAALRQGDALPPLAPIDPAGAPDLAPIARWGVGALRSAALAPDGGTLAVGTELGVILYDMPDLGRRRALLGPPAEALAFTPDSRTLAIAQGDGRVALLDLAADAPPALIAAAPPRRSLLERLLNFPSFGGIAPAIAFSADGAALATMTPAGVVELWDHAAGRRLGRLALEDEYAPALAFAPDGALLIGQTIHDAEGMMRSAQVVRWNPQQGQGVEPLVALDESVGSLAVSADGGMLVVIDARGRALRWSLPDGAPLDPLAAEAGTFAPDGRTVATIGPDDQAQIWDLTTGQLLQTLLPATAGSYASRIAYDGRTLLLLGDDGALLHWDAATGTMRDRRRLAGFLGAIEALAYSPDGKSLALGTERGVLLLDSADGRVIARIDDRSGAADLAYSADGSLLAVRHHSGGVTIWRLPERVLQATLTLPDAWVEATAFAPDGSAVATGVDERNRLILQRAADGAELWAADNAHREKIRAIAFTPDSRTVITTAWDGRIKLWDAQNGQVQADLDARSSSIGMTLVEALAISPDGSRLALMRATQGIDLWDLDRRQRVGSLRGVGIISAIDALAFAPAGDVLAGIGSYTAPLVLWDVATRERLVSLELPGAAQRRLAFAPDGTRLAVSGSDGAVWIFGVAPPPP